MTMDLDVSKAVAALRANVRAYQTDMGERRGFLMSDAVSALETLAKASDALSALMVLGVVASEPVLIAGDVQTLYEIDDGRLDELTEKPGQTVH